jgi:hypothetical protein
MRKLAGVLVVGCLAFAVGYGLGFAMPASAASHASYPLGKAKSCRVNFHKVNRVHWVRLSDGRRVKRGYVDCVWRAPKAKSLAPVKLAVHLDPLFTQSANDPLAVVYTASATAATNGVGGPQLPAGVLDFYSDGALACSTDVGGSATTTTCPVTYAALGQHTVITEYISGTDSASETDIEQVNGQATKTSVTLQGDPVDKTTTSILTATVSSPLGTDTAPPATSVSFTVDGAVLTTVKDSQTTCTLNWSGAPTFNQGDNAFVDSATSPDCTVTGVPLTNVEGLTYSASFAGTLGLSASTSGATSVTDWPQVPGIITEAGDNYDVSFGTFQVTDFGPWIGVDVSVTDGGSPVIDPGFVTFTESGSTVCVQFGNSAADPCFDYPIPAGQVTAMFTPGMSPAETIEWIGDQEYVLTHALVGTSTTQAVS